MEILSKNEFLELADKSANLCVSLYLPTHKSGFEVNEKQDRLLFKNMLKDVEKQLAVLAHDQKEIDRLLESANQLLYDESFWYKLNQGLGVFLAENFFKVVHIPKAVEQETYINNRFYIAPLVFTLTDSEHFYLLTISKNASSFYEGNSYSLKELLIEGLPQGMNDVIHFEEKSERRLFRGGGNLTGKGANFHGHDAGLADEKEYISAYLKEVDQTLWTEKLARENAPMLLAGVEYMVGFYKQISNYKHIVEDYISGNYDHVDAKILFAKAKELMQPIFGQKKQNALDTYYNRIATGESTDDIKKLVPASYYGQIADLFVKRGAHIWGNFNAETNQLTIHTEKQEKDECLINSAIVQTVHNGGNVYLLDEVEMPNGSKVAANLRYQT